MASSGPTTSRTRPQRTTTNRRRYREPDTDSETDQDLFRQTSRPARASRRLQSYREESDSDGASEPHEYDSSTSALEGETDIQRQPVSARHEFTSRKRNVRAQATHQRNQFSSFKRRKFVQSLPPNGKTIRDASPIDFPVRTRIPPWQQLDYQIWVMILGHASSPLYDDAGRCNPSVSWLLAMSRLCRSLHDAAIAVLTWSPPLHPAYRAHGFLDLLSKPPSELTLDYSTKVHALDIEVKQLLMRKSGIQLEELITKTPLLQHLRIFHGHDDLMGKFIWAKAMFGHDKWAYGNLFDILDDSGIRLRSFEWNGRFRDTIDAMLRSASRPSTSTLRRLKFINFCIEERQEHRRVITRDTILNVLSTLTDLTALEFSNCTIVDWEFMPRVPQGLSALTIANCQALTSDSLEDYLTAAGRTLQKLHLIGNQVMDLGFTSNLKHSCPNLQDLFIDLTYEDSSSYSDRDPLYDHLLPQGRPTWPTRLESLVIEPLRSLSVSDAEDFYQSLIDAAEELPFLRHLSLKTLLKDASWRDRAQLRSKWSAIIYHVFSAGQYNMTLPSSSRMDASSDSTHDNKRKSARIQELEENHSSEATRRIELEKNIAVDLLPRHNRCGHVQFELSDQRPAQEQYREEDFLDDELSGDEEWNER